MPEYALRGRCSAGNTFVSNSASIVAHGHDGKGHTIGKEAGEAIFIASQKALQKQPKVARNTAGGQCSLGQRYSPAIGSRP